MTKVRISFPHIGNYYVPAKYLFTNILDADIMIAPFITNKTIELGNKYSPEFVCTPFKYTLGTMIEALENKTDILVQLGGGCRYGYYSELQEKILKDLGYKFILINLIRAGKTDFKRIYKSLKRIDKKLSLFKSLYYLYITIKMVKYMDKIDDYIRKNIGFEIEKNSFINLQQEMLKKFGDVKTPVELYLLYRKYFRKFKSLATDKPKSSLKVGIIGELYTVMEPFSNYNLERELASFNIEIKRFTNVDYLLLNSRKIRKRALRKTKDYMHYKMSADASSNIYWAKYLCLKKYDGIIHIKSSFCTPEIGIMPIIDKIASDYNVPLIHFSFDANTSEVGFKTRIEAFYDMIEMRKTQ